MPHLMINRITAKLLQRTGPLAWSSPRLIRGFGGVPSEGPSLKPFPRDDASGYFLNPEEVATRMLSIVALHDQVKNREEMTLKKTFHQLGIDDLTKVELFLEIEREFDIEFADDDVEAFKNFGDAVEHVSKSFHSK